MTSFIIHTGRLCVMTKSRLDEPTIAKPRIRSILAPILRLGFGASLWGENMFNARHRAWRLVYRMPVFANELGGGSRVVFNFENLKYRI